MRNSISVLLLTLAASLLLGGCGRSSKKSSSAAYELDGKTLIAEQRCTKKRRTYDYMACGKKVRAQVKAKLCTGEKGTRKYLYRVGNSEPRVTSVYCKG